MTIPEILLMLAEIAAARAVVASEENQHRRHSAALEWQSYIRAVTECRGRKPPSGISSLHEWRKTEIAKAVAKVRASFGVAATTNQIGLQS